MDVSIGVITVVLSVAPGINEDVIGFEKSDATGQLQVAVNFNSTGPKDDLSLQVFDPFGGSYGSDSSANRKGEFLVIQEGLSGDFRVQIVNETDAVKTMTLTASVVAP